MPTSSKTVSTCTAETAQGTHVFNIVGYSKHRGIGVNKYITSGTFSVGGQGWSIIFFPDGITKLSDSILVALVCRKSGLVRASYDLRLVDQSTGSSSSVRKVMPVEGEHRRSSVAVVTKRSVFEGSTYLRDDRITIECTVTVFEEPHVSNTKSFPEIEVPPSDLTEQLGKLLDEKEGCDVTFSVGGDTFGAHKLVLAMRSPVFRAELYGLMREARAEFVTVEDMQPAVFRALLHFIYNDALPVMDDRDGDDKNEMVRHLLVAADRYAMERLKLVCQSILCKNLSVETVATTLALADQHNCDRLKDACLQFITCSNALDAVVATKGYKNLKRACPSIIVDALEKTKSFRAT